MSELMEQLDEGFFNWGKWR